MKQSRNAAIGFIFITMTIDVIGFGLIIPVMPKLIVELKHISINEASVYGGDLLALYAIMQLLFSPFMGNLSDRYGRRPVLLLSLLGFCVDYLILAFAHTYSLLVVGRILSGITGASFTTATAYIADISTNENRAKNFGLIGAAFGLGFVIGPALGGLLSVWGLRAPFFAAAGLCLLNFLYGYFVLPESLKPEHRRPFSWLKANPVGSLRLFFNYPGILGLVLCFLFIFLGGHAVQSNWSYFTMDQFKWSEKEVGISLAIVGVLVGVVQGGLIRYTNPRLGNEKSAYIGLFFYAFGMILFAFATSSWMMYAFLVPYCMGGIAGPALQALITNEVPANEQGALQGGLNAVMSLTSIIGPPMMTRTFFYFSHDQAPVYFPGAPFVLGAALMLISAVIAYYVLHVKKKPATVI
ncbi:TCR/Tet family MFS transporter [Niabella sp. CC-SYL272]|uniref:TCR/Tet family MFS transporter n=1 Tax=Niabella agricola TaxID=2891571 RepID=UPI001F43C6B6|nr:TCR/Tet family MFS transporter [Niabella agricola]MCF3111034.1 TCR/Tet family MFS transporter [Niabella agricola]